MAWEKEHWRLDRRRLVRVAMTPDEIGLCGCWQVIAVRCEREELDPRAKPPSDEMAYYVTSVVTHELGDEDLMEGIRGHWSAIENGSHHRRDVSFGDDACRVAKRPGGHALATLRNLAIGLYELELDEGRVETGGCTSWRRRMTVAAALDLLRS